MSPNCSLEQKKLYFTEIHIPILHFFHERRLLRFSGPETTPPTGNSDTSEVPSPPPGGTNAEEQTRRERREQRQKNEKLDQADEAETLADIEGQMQPNTDSEVQSRQREQKVAGIQMETVRDMLSPSSDGRTDPNASQRAADYILREGNAALRDRVIQEYLLGNNDEVDFSAVLQKLGQTVGRALIPYIINPDTEFRRTGAADVAANANMDQVSTRAAFLLSVFIGRGQNAGDDFVISAASQAYARAGLSEGSYTLLAGALCENTDGILSLSGWPSRTGDRRQMIALEAMRRNIPGLDPPRGNGLRTLVSSVLVAADDRDGAVQNNALGVLNAIGERWRISLTIDPQPRNAALPSLRRRATDLQAPADIRRAAIAALCQMQSVDDALAFCLERSAVAGLPSGDLVALMNGIEGHFTQLYQGNLTANPQTFTRPAMAAWRDTVLRLRTEGGATVRGEATRHLGLMGVCAMQTGQAEFGQACLAGAMENPTEALKAVLWGNERNFRTLCTSLASAPPADAQRVSEYLCNRWRGYGENFSTGDDDALGETRDYLRTTLELFSAVRDRLDRTGTGPNEASLRESLQKSLRDAGASFQTAADNILESARGNLPANTLRRLEQNVKEVSAVFR